MFRMIVAAEEVVVAILLIICSFKEVLQKEQPTKPPTADMSEYQSTPVAMGAQRLKKSNQYITVQKPTIPSRRYDGPHVGWNNFVTYIMELPSPCRYDWDRANSSSADGKV